MIAADPSFSWHQCHVTLPGYSPDQVLHSGCRACDDLAAYPWLVIQNMEAGAFEAAWQRAVRMQRHGLPDVSAAELPLLQVFLAMSAQMAKRGVPWGTIPSGERAAAGASA